MAYFHCLIQQGGGSGIPLVVTCASAFAGLTITCTDGTTTLTDTCPSSSPYEITFNLPNTGTWTVSGTISGTTYTESVLVEEFDCELLNNIDLSIDFYSAANDTVSYTGIDNETHTITTDSSGHASATITINANGNSITFTGSVAKDPSNLSNYFSKTVALTSSTTTIYLMPVDDPIYWYGYRGTELQIANTSNGWSMPSRNSYPNPTFNTNDAVIAINAANVLCGIGGANTITGTVKIIAASVSGVSEFKLSDSKTLPDSTSGDTQINSTTVALYTKSSSSKYAVLYTEARSQAFNRSVRLYGFWYE